MKIRKENCVAIAIDYQERLLPVMSKEKEILRRSEILLSGLRELGVSICMTQQYTKGLGMTSPVIVNAVGSAEYIEKIEFSAYAAIYESIKEKQFAIVCGIEAHICVLQTVIDLKEHGFIPVVVVDCIGSRNKQDEKIALKRMKAEGGILTTSESILFELLERAGTETSKKIQRLIK